MAKSATGKGKSIALPLAVSVAFLLNQLHFIEALPRFLLWDNRIVGGKPAEEGQFPYQVSLLYNSKHICGGSLIASDWILTAAHCCPYAMNRYQVKAGTYIYNDPCTSLSCQQQKVVKMIPHEKYNSTSLENDIALVQVGPGFNLTDNKDHIATIPLAPIDFITDDQICTITGWGTLTEGGAPSPVLQSVTVPTVSNIKCNEYYPGEVSPTMMCAGLEEGGKDSCQGDSGGPLIIEDGNEAKILTGIVSWGYGCARPGNPGVYTRVQCFLDWISSTIKANSV